MARLALTTRLAFALLLAAIVAAPAAEATWPGSNGRIYFICRDVGGSFDSYDVCAVNPDGSGLVNLTNTPTVPENTPSVSRDGRLVSFIRGSFADARLWVMNADGSNARAITDVTSDGGNFTPNGLSVAFRSRVDTTFEFRLAPTAGGASTFLGPATGTHTPPEYAADGRYVYSRSEPIPGSPGSFNEQVFVVANGSEVRVTPIGSGSNSFPSWSPDGGRIVYNRLVSSDMDLFASSSGGGGSETPLTNTPTLSENWGSFSPDGTKLVYHRDDNGFLEEILVIANADGSGATPIPTPTLATARTATWAPVAGGATPPPPAKTEPSKQPISVKPSTRKLPAGKALTLTLGCNVAPRCVISYGASVSIPNSVLASKTFKVEARKVTVANGKTRKVKLKLPRKAAKAVRKALKKGKKPKLKVAVTARRPDGKLLRKSRLSISLKP